MKITGCLHYEISDHQFWSNCKMSIVDIAPHLADVATFAIHKSASGAWQITNVETGCAVSRGKHLDRRESLQLARRRLFSKTVSDIEKVYKKTFKASTLLRREARRK